MAARVEAMEDRQLLAVANSMIGLDLGAAIAQVAARKAANPRLDPALVDLSNQMARGRSAETAMAAMAATSLPMLSDAFGRVAVTVTASDVNNVLPKLQAFGFSSTFADAKLHTIEGYLPITSLSAAAGLGPDGLLGILPIYRPGSAAGSVLTQADYVLEAGRVHQTPAVGVNGSGVTVGILSNSFNSLGGYASDISTGDLPAGVQIVQENSGNDEGRAMAQLIHDLAPGARLAFATGSFGQGALANNIRALANPAGPNAKVITDDTFYGDEPMFQDGLIAQAINEVASKYDVAYFSAAGNFGSNAYESTTVSFTTDSGFADEGPVYYNFNPGGAADTRQRITVNPGQRIGLVLQWDDPFYTTDGVDSDLDFYLLDGDEIVAYSDRYSIENQTPSEVLSYRNTTGVAQTLDLAIVLYEGPAPTRLKWADFASNGTNLTVNEYATNSPILIAHSAAAGAMSVAAAPYYDQLNPESYSSLGPFTALFNADGTRLATPEVRQAPGITAIDGTDTTFFGSDSRDNNGRPNFFGTSAAAPHAAAVAALVRSANPGLSSAQVYNRMTSTATDIDTFTGSGIGVASGVDNRTGSGLVNAFRAIYGPATAASLPVRDGFEASSLSTNWDTFALGAGRTLVATNNGPASGSYHLTMDSSINSYVGLNEATLLVNTAGVAGDVLLSFRQREFNEDDDPMPASFAGRSLTDGVAFSVDGSTWYRLVSLTGSDSTNSYRTFSYNLSAAARALGLTLGATTRIRFQRFGGGTITGPTNGTPLATPTGGIAFDDVRVAAASTVASAVVDDRGAQRSVVRQVVLNVNGVVASAPASAFAITRTQDNAAFTPTVAITYPTATTSRITLTFTGSGTEFGSLPDGDYTLVVDGDQILDDLGGAVDVDGDGRVGGTRTVAFFRLFGDSDGDRDVDGTDFNLFRQAYLGQIPLPSYFDFNNSGTVVNDPADRDAFLARRGKRLTTGGVVFA